ncbi:hypothetical protein PIB30_040253 [Stylosanthes scabra]|uniref:Uncharacterized protein n=1 Tax=Stylosanthes scabra TaxID=79078 RepID=A0ABU6VD22_9FABA|nr:hypothetical protein [Stylosanthes scabra]
MEFRNKFLEKEPSMHIMEFVRTPARSHSWCTNALETWKMVTPPSPSLASTAAYCRYLLPSPCSTALAVHRARALVCACLAPQFLKSRSLACTVLRRR